MARAWTAAQVASVGWSHIWGAWKIGINSTFHAYLQLVCLCQVSLTHSLRHLCLLLLLIVRRILMHLHRLLVCVDVLGPLLDLRPGEVVSDRIFACLHISVLLRVHEVISDKDTAWLERALVLIGISSIRGVLWRVVLVQINALGWSWQFRAESLTFARCRHRHLSGSILVLTHLPRCLAGMLVKLLVPCAAQIALLVGRRLVHKAVAVVLAAYLRVLFQVIITEVPISLVFSSLLGAKDKGIVVLGHVSVFIGHFRRRPSIILVITHATRDLLIVVVHRHGLPRLIIEVGCCMRSLLEGEWMGFASHRSLRIPLHPGDDGVVIGKSIQINVDRLHHELYSHLASFSCRVSWFRLFGAGNRVLLHKGLVLLLPIADQGLDVLLLLADLLSILGGTVWITNHHIWSVKLIDLLVPRSGISNILSWALAISLSKLTLLAASMRSVDLSHV